jgi:hypothetical protein
MPINVLMIFKLLQCMMSLLDVLSGTYKSDTVS